VDKHQFDFTARVVWEVLEPWLRLHFGDKCADYEYGCHTCKRWRLAEKLLAYEEDRSAPQLEEEIAELEEAITWRRRLLSKLKAGPRTQDKPEVALTAHEKRVLDKLTDFWNDYLTLPDARDSICTPAVCNSVNNIQGVLAMRVAKRANPEVWA